MHIVVMAKTIVSRCTELTSLQAAIWFMYSPSVKMMFCPSECWPTMESVNEYQIILINDHSDTVSFCGLLCTWHDDCPVRLQCLRVDLDGRHGVVTGVPIQQVALRTQHKHSCCSLFFDLLVWRDHFTYRIPEVHITDLQERHLDRDQPEQSPATISSPFCS